MARTIEQNRRDQLGQAIASARIEGFSPSPAFLADCDQFVRGKMTTEDIRAASLARARESERAAAMPDRERDAA